jgi:hypothetical protein
MFMRSSAKNSRRRDTIRRYLKRSQLYPFQVSAEPSLDLGLVVVIPCFDEPDILSAICSLEACARPDCDVEILIVVNAPERAERPALENNARVMSQISEWNSNRSAEWLRCYGICHQDLPARFAGVGLARKIGMDEAVGRFVGTSRCDGLIASLDADSKVAPNYLYELRHEFSSNRGCPGISIHFEHPVSNLSSSVLREAIVQYELHLRCYVAGQRLAGFPYAFHTIGSSMACRADVYASQGGMNRRKGGEDFYFIQKLIALGGYRALTTTTVYPGVRISNRVPFGTGPALKKAVVHPAEFESYSPKIFRDLEHFCKVVAKQLPEDFEDSIHNCPVALQRFLEQQKFVDRLKEIRGNVVTVPTFRKRVFRWFNAFRFLKFAQFASREYYPKLPVTAVAGTLAESLGMRMQNGNLDSDSLLSWYRDLDRVADISHPGFRSPGNSV